MYIEAWLFWTCLIILVLWIIVVTRWTAFCAKKIDYLESRFNKHCKETGEALTLVGNGFTTIGDELDKKQDK